MKDKGDEAQAVCDSNYCLISGYILINQIPVINLIRIYFAFWTIQNIQFRCLGDEILCFQSMAVGVVSQVTVNRNSAMLRTMEIWSVSITGVEPKEGLIHFV